MNISPYASGIILLVWTKGTNAQLYKHVLAEERACPHLRHLSVQTSSFKPAQAKNSPRVIGQSCTYSGWRPKTPSLEANFPVAALGAS